MIFVTKVDGRKQVFEKSKIYKTCVRMGATPEQAEQIAEKIASEVYDGISTKRILNMIFSYMKIFKPEFKYKIDLREAISMLRPKPDFETFVAQLLKSEGYEVRQNVILSGECVEHEIDVIATKGNEIVYVEVKHHLNPHAYTGLDVFLEAYSAFLDLKDGYKTGKNKINFNKVLVVCNTKISDHAKKYSECRGIMHIGWKYPVENGLERMIEERKLYPITILKGVDQKTRNKLCDAGIVTLKQLLENDVKEMQRKTNIEKNKLNLLISKAREVI